MSAPTVDIVIVSWNGRADTVRAVEATLEQIGGGSGQVPDARITVVDNGSSDGIWEETLRFGGNVRCARLKENRGFTGGVKAGIEVSDAEFVILLNNDAVPEENWLESMVNGLASAEDDVIAASGKIISYDRSAIDFIGGAMTFDGHAFQCDFGRPVGSVKEPEQGAELLFACGGNMIVRREPYLEIGGLDDDYVAYLEDVDFGWRSWLSGWRVVYQPDGVARHKSSATSDRLGAFERGVLFERNALQTAIKNYDADVLREMSGPIFLTLLHRMHRYAVERNRESEPLSRPAFEGEPKKPAAGLLQRIRTKLQGTSENAVIDDPLTVMQFRAVDWFFRNKERVLQKRNEIQARRSRSDKEIFERFPLLEVPTYHGDEELFSSSLFKALRPQEPGFEQKTLEELMKR